MLTRNKQHRPGADLAVDYSLDPIRRGSGVHRARCETGAASRCCPVETSKDLYCTRSVITIHVILSSTGVLIVMPKQESATLNMGPLSWLQSMLEELQSRYGN